MSNDTDKQIRLAIKAVGIAPSYPEAAVYPWNALSHDIAEWPGLFRTDDDTTHGWIIKRSGTASNWRTFMQKVNRSWAYDLFGFYGFRSGMQGDNSDDEWGEILDTVWANIKASYNLGLEGVVERHELLQFASITTIDTGEETLHFAHGRLTVELCC